MIFLTHLLGGIFSIAYFGGFLGIDTGIGSVVIAALFAILPDIDMVKSKAGKHLQPFSTLISLLFRHRGFLHSFVFAAAVYLVMQYLFSSGTAAAALVGYSSHLLLDSLTKEGIRPFAPFSKARLRGFIRTGGFLEKVILVAFAVLLVLQLG